MVTFVFGGEVKGFIDAMIYDVAAALDLKEERGCVDDWIARNKRRKILRKKFLGE